MTAPWLSKAPEITSKYDESSISNLRQSAYATRSAYWISRVALAIYKEWHIGKIVQRTPPVPRILELRGESLKTSLACRLVEDDQATVSVANLIVVAGDESVESIGELLEGVLNRILGRASSLVDNNPKQAPAVSVQLVCGCQPIPNYLTPYVPGDPTPRTLAAMHVVAVQLEAGSIFVTGFSEDGIECFTQPVDLALGTQLFQLE